jgi:hypothetical protein
MSERIKKGGEIQPSPLVEVLRPDPDHASGLVVLRGYPGPASDPARIRLYIGLAFKSYYELNRADIVAHWSTDPDDPNATIVVAIEPTTKFDLMVGSVPGTALSFLQGEIVSNNLSSSLQATITEQLISAIAEALTLPTCVYKSCNKCE